MYRKPSPSPVLAPNITASSSNIQRGLHVSKLYYFFFFGAIGSIVPFFNVYLEQIGMTGTQIGLIGSLAPLIALTSNPLWGSIADRWQIHRQLLAGLALASGLISLFFLGAQTFWMIMLVVIGLSFFRTPIPALVDSTVMSLVAQAGSSYGRQRMWGSLGFVLATYGLGQLVNLQDLRLIFWLHAGLLAVGCALLSLLLPIQGGLDRVNILTGLRTLAARPGYLSYLAGMVLLGVGAAGFANFLGLHILELGGTESQVGMAWALNAITEIPIMFMGARWFGRVRYSRQILIGFIGFILAWFALALAQTPAQVLMAIPLTGVCYGFFWVAAVGYAAESAPKGLEATAQSLAGAAQSGLGWGIGSLIAGALWDAAGGHVVLFTSAGVMVMAAVIFWAGNRRTL